MKKKALITSILMVALCLCLIAGSTYALFTSKEELRIEVTAGNVEVTAEIDTALKTWSLGEDAATPRTDGSFANGGMAKVGTDGVLVLSNMTPGDSVKFTINVENKSTVAVRYNVKAETKAVDGASVDLTGALVCVATINGVDYTMSKTQGAAFETGWFDSVTAPDGVGGEIKDITVTLSFPNGLPDHDNDFKNGKANITFVVEAVQGNGIANGEMILPTP